MTTTIGKKSILITGCSPGGIGHSLALEFRRAGLHVFASARDRIVLADLEQLGITTISLDVTSAESISQARVEVERATGGGLDILVNNAGRNLTLPALDVTLQEARLCFETNFFGVIAVTQTFAPALIKQKGLVLNIGSVAAIVPYVFGSVYNASKAALHAWSQALRLELEPFGVRVQVVITGGVQSRIARTSRILPAGSLYLPVNEEFQRRVSHSQEGAMPNEKYARSVVAAALKKTPAKWVWQGNKSFLIKFVSQWIGSWVFDLILPRMFGLAKFTALMKAKAKRS